MDRSSTPAGSAVGRVRLVFVALAAASAGFLLAYCWPTESRQVAPAEAPLRFAHEEDANLREVAVVDSPPPPVASKVRSNHLEHALALIREETEGVLQHAPSEPQEYWYALAAMNFAQSHIRPALYGRRLSNNAPLPQSLEECLEYGAGICGHHVEFMLKCMNEFDIKARPIEVYRVGLSDNHIMIEVWYEGAWRLFDPTWGTVYRKPNSPPSDLLSAADVLTNPSVVQFALVNRTDLWFKFAEVMESDALEYLSWSERDIVIDNAGVIRLQPREHSEFMVRYAPSDRPAFLGSNRERTHGDTEGLVCSLLEIPADADGLTIDVTGKVGEGWLHIRGGDTDVAVELSSLDVGENEIQLSGAPSNVLRLSVEPTGDLNFAYVVYQSIAVTREERQKVERHHE